MGEASLMPTGIPGSNAHGTDRRYRRGCRCEACCAAYADQLAKNRERKKRYRGVCEDCGGPTTGCDGKDKAPKVCASCHNKRREPPHGTRSRYSAGCSCDACRQANTEYQRTLRGRPVPRHGTQSGYQNYGCRCDACRKAHSDALWLSCHSARYPRRRAAA